MKRLISNKPYASFVPMRGRFAWWLLLLATSVCAQSVVAQDQAQKVVEDQIQKLTDAMVRTQAQLQESQRQLEEIRSELTALKQRLAKSGGAPAGNANAAAVTSQNGASSSLSEQVEELRERVDVQQSQIATHEQAKVESASKYRVKITGLVLFNGYVNTNQVDMPVTPTIAISGAGSTGASVKQTILGIDAQGPHLFGAQSYADLRVDFDGTAQGANGASYAGAYGSSTTLLRLRTAHAGLQWNNTTAGFSLDRPLMSPEAPTSLTAVAEPALAWSGNLWTWNPQVGISHDIGIGRSAALRLETSLIDVGDAPYSASSSPVAQPAQAASSGELSRWPGVESRIALLRSGTNEEGNRFGIGGYFSPHRSWMGYRYDAWAATVDEHLLLPFRLQLSGSAYRGLALGGLGAGAFKDYAYRIGASGDPYFRPLDDVGGWAQLKAKIDERVQLNAAVGIDELLKSDLQRYFAPGGSTYQNLLANRTYTGNVIYSPSSYLLFSLQYSHLRSTPIIGPAATADVIGIAAGYKF